MLRYSTKTTLRLSSVSTRWGRVEISTAARCFSTDRGPTGVVGEADTDLYSKDRVNAMVAHNFPDYIEWWNRENFRLVGYGLMTATAVSAVGGALSASATAVGAAVPALVLGSLTAGYWHVGLQDMRQKSHAIRRNYPVLGNVRYLLETVRADRTLLTGPSNS